MLTTPPPPTLATLSTFNQAVLAEATGVGLGKLGSLKQANCCVNVLDYCIADGSVEVVATNLPLPSDAIGGE